jgi:hypothetical protein
MVENPVCVTPNQVMETGNDLTHRMRDGFGFSDNGRDYVCGIFLLTGKGKTCSYVIIAALPI